MEEIHSLKHETRSTKSETNPNGQNPKVPNVLYLHHLNFLGLFRISIFGFRICRAWIPDHVGNDMRYIQSMKNQTRKNNGFSLIETVIVVAILSIVAYASLGSLGSARDRSSLQDAQASILHAFEAARSRAVTGIGMGDHGVHLEANRIVAFEGSAYTGAGNETLLPLFTSTNQVSSTIIFRRLSAHASASTTVTITSPRGSTSTIAVTYDGAIIPQ